MASTRSSSVPAPPLVALALIITSLAFFSTLPRGESHPPLVKGLSWTFYKSSCPTLQKISRHFLKKAFKKDVGLAAGLLRLHFHDCYVQGCDASLLLDGPERNAVPNQTLRPSALQAIRDIRALVDQHCGPRVVSCTDIVTLATRDAVRLAGGPHYHVPLGRRDGFTSATVVDLPSPDFNVSSLLCAFAKVNLDATDLVALSGGHTVGLGHCVTFQKRLFPSQDPIMDKTFANSLRRSCPVNNTVNTTVMDIRSPKRFDNKYYVDLMNRQGLFTSDQDLYTDVRTRPIVKSFAVSQALFFKKFAAAMTKLGQVNVLTGNQGEIRAQC